METIAYGKVGHTTGAFSTEIISLNLSGTVSSVPIILRESPTLASAGTITIRDLGGWGIAAFLVLLPLALRRRCRR